MNLKFFKIKTPVLTLFALMLFFAACEKDPFEANSGTFTDERDGREYKWVKIGDQIWMAENLAYVPYVCAPDSQCGIWIYGYDGEGSYGTNYHTYGALYDWETAMEVCPEGWHLPSDQEWMELERFLGMEEDQLDRTGIIRGAEANVGGKLKEIGNAHWNGYNEWSTNETGFSALPGGLLYEKRFAAKGGSAYFWTSSSSKANYAFSRMLSVGGQDIYRDNDKKSLGYSVRCVKY